MDRSRRRAVRRPGIGHLPMLSAVAEGLITRKPGWSSSYVLDGEPIGTNQVRALASMGLVDAPFSGPPSITEDGMAALAELSARLEAEDE